jgi:hypothetical protein
MAVLALGRYFKNPKRWCRRDPTIAEILSDSIVQAMMEADGIDPQVLEAQLRNMARDLSRTRAARA